jgi:hypothetical protein
MLVELHTQVRENAVRVARLGQWPPHIDAKKSLMSRIPEGDSVAPGLDAGLACALDLIPRDKQKLAATLHAAYTKAAVEQVRGECDPMQSDSETAWWLAACSLCKEGNVDEQMLREQISRFETLAADPEARVLAAKSELSSMVSNFTINEFGVPYGIKDGCIQGAYLAGHEFATMYLTEYGVYFIGTFHETLGLEDFPWSDEKDGQGRPKSGPVFGSRQFVKAANHAEYVRALQGVLAHF